MFQGPIAGFASARFRERPGKARHLSTKANTSPTQGEDTASAAASPRVCLQSLHAAICLSLSPQPSCCPSYSQSSENMSTAKKQRTTGAATDDNPKASSTPIHPWVKLMTEHNMTLEEVAKHTYKAHSFEGLSFEPENQAKLEPPTRLKTDAPSKPVSKPVKKPVKKPVSVFLKEETEAQTFDYLVVAANPRELMGYG
eukprot:scaffold98803_cov33-Phaeocystis_antarctica.AAC.1